MVHAVFAAMAAAAALNVMAASSVSLFATMVVKVVVPQPVLVGAAVPARVQLGSVSTILSLTARVAFSLKDAAMVVLEPATGVANTSEVPENAATGVGAGPLREDNDPTPHTHTLPLEQLMVVVSRL
jgi:hypothetical protein